MMKIIPFIIVSKLQTAKDKPVRNSKRKQLDYDYGK